MDKPRLTQARYVCLFLAAVLTFAAFGEVYYQLILSKRAVLAVSLSYPGAELGQNPDGSRFCVSELTGDQTLDQAKARLNLDGPSNDVIRSCISVTTRLDRLDPGETAAELARNPEASFVPTTVYLRCDPRGRLGQTDSGQLLQALAESWSSRLKARREGDSVLSFRPDSLLLDSYEYAGSCAVLSAKAERMLEQLELYRREAPAFRLEDGLSFDLLSQRLRTFREVTLEGFQSYVEQNGIVKDRSAWLGQLDCRIHQTERQYQTAARTAQLAQQALEAAGSGLDGLAETAWSSGLQASRRAGELDRLRTARQVLDQAADPSPAQLSGAEQSLQELISGLAQLSEQCVELERAYLQDKTREYITWYIRGPEEGDHPGAVLRFAAAGALLSAAFLCQAAFRGSVRKAGGLI